MKTALAGVRELARILEIEARVEGRIRSMQVNIGLTTFNLEKLDDGDIAGLVKEKFDAPDIKTLVDRILERFPGYSEPAARP